MKYLREPLYIGIWNRKIHPPASFPARSASNNEQKEDRTMTIRQRLREEYTNRTVHEKTDILTAETRRVLKPNSIERNKSSRNEEKRGQWGDVGIKRKP